MDINKKKAKAIDKFLDELNTKKTSNIKCPVCNTKLNFEGNSTAYSVFCETPNCLKEEFRGI